MPEHPAQRLVRSLYATWFPTLPFFSVIFDKCGQVLATVENGMRLLEQDNWWLFIRKATRGWASCSASATGWPASGAEAS